MKKGVILTLFILIFIYSIDASIISGKIYEDFNGNSLIENETAQQNITMILFNIDDYKIININTNNEGYYEFNVNPGKYILSQKLSDEEMFTYPEFGFYYITIDDDKNFIDNNFGVFKLGKIYGKIYDESGTPLYHAKVTLSNGYSYLTDKDGYYKFKYLESGTYTLSIEDKSKEVIINSKTVIEQDFNVAKITEDTKIEEVSIKEDLWLDRVYASLFK